MNTPEIPLLTDASCPTDGAPLARHAAARAWRRARPGHEPPRAIEVVRKRGGAVAWRLRGAGPGGGSLIAKRCGAGPARFEMALYEEILPGLPVSAPRLVGSTADTDDRFHWIFLQDGGETFYDPEDSSHRELVTRWMASLHTSACGRPPARDLPDRGPAHFLQQLESARARIEDRLRDPILCREHVPVLEKIRLCLDIIASFWPALLEICDDAPATLVHGCLARRNIRVRRDGEGHALLAFEWGEAGWGAPAIDLARCPLISLYGYLVRPQWPSLTPARIRDLKDAGALFLAVTAINRHVRRIGPRSVERPIRRLHSSYTQLDGVLTRMAMRS